MRTNRRRLRAAAVLAVATACASVPLTTAAHAATPPTVTLSVEGNAPGSDPTVSGLVHVTATVTAAPGSPVQSLSYGFPSVDNVAHVITFAPGQCDTTCTYSWTLDTTALKPLQAGGAGAPVVPDQAETVRALARSADGYSNVFGHFTVDNHRPSLGTARLSTGLLATTPEKLSFTVAPTVSATAPAGTTIADVELVAPGSTTWPVSHFVRNADGTWTIGFPPGSLPGGSYASLAAVAIDSNGTVGVPATTDQVVVDAGFTLTPPATTVTGTNWNGLTVGVQYAGGVGCNNAFTPTDLQLQVDGQAWQDVPASVLSGGGTCAVQAGPGTPVKPLPFGRHTLTWTVTDSLGVKATASAPVTVAAPLTATWPRGSRTIVAGSALHVTATGITAPDGFSKLKSWTVTDQYGNVLSSGTGATAPSVTVNTPVNQETGTVLFVHLTSDSGLTSYYGFTYQTGWATAAYAHVSATSVRRGSSVSLYASDWVRVNGTWTYDVHSPAKVQYQWAYRGSNVWHNAAAVNVTAAAPKPGAVRMRVSANECFRAVYTQTQPVETEYGTDLIPATSAPVCVAVH